jgi:hypothetical protein
MARSFGGEGVTIYTSKAVKIKDHLTIGQIKHLYIKVLE